MGPNAGMNRREFLHTSMLTAAAGASLRLDSLLAAEQPKGVSWPIGCFNRPWLGNKSNPSSYDTALDGIKAAGVYL